MPKKNRKVLYCIHCKADVAHDVLKSESGTEYRCISCKKITNRLRK